MQREPIQLVKRFHQWECPDGVEFYKAMVVEVDQFFKGLIEHLCDAFQLGETLSELISNFYDHAQKAKDTFSDDLQGLARKILACKLSFSLEAIQQAS